MQFKSKLLLRSALSHLRELEEAWRSGALDEHDGKGGERSNRNVALAREIQEHLLAPHTVADLTYKRPAIPLPEGWLSADTPHPQWRVGKVFQLGYCPVTKRTRRAWYDVGKQLTIRPYETGREAYIYECDVAPSARIFVCWRDM